MRLIKRAIFICGLVSLAVLVLAFAGTTYLIQRGQYLNRESRAYADATIAAVASQWSADALLQRASPQFLKTSTPEAVRAFVASAASRYGALISYDGAEGQATSVEDIDRGTQIVAIYMSHAKFQKGDVEFQIALVKVGERWMISGFHLTAPQPTTGFVDRSA